MWSSLVFIKMSILIVVAIFIDWPILTISRLFGHRQIILLLFVIEWMDVINASILHRRRPFIRKNRSPVYWFMKLLRADHRMWIHANSICDARVGLRVARIPDLIRPKKKIEIDMRNAFARRIFSHFPFFSVRTLTTAPRLLKWNLRLNFPRCILHTVRQQVYWPNDSTNW